MATRKFFNDVQAKNNLSVDNALTLSALTTERALAINASGAVVASATTETELGFLSGVTSAIQTQLDAKADEVDVVLRDGSQDFTADQSMGGFKLTNLAAPTADNDAARKADVDAASAGQLPKDPVDLVSTSDITLSGEQTIDGTLTSASRVLVAGQTDASENGIYTTGAGAWVRTLDFDGTPNGEVARGNIALVLGGSSNANTQYILNATDAADPAAIDVGTETNSWVIYSRAQDVAAGDGLDKSGLELSVNVSEITGSGLEDDGSNNIRIASSAAGTGLTGGSGSALAIDFGTSGQQAIAADTLASNSNGEGAALVGIEDAGGDFTATTVEGALTELKSDLDLKQNDVITAEGDLVIGNGSGEESALSIGANGTFLGSDGSTASWQVINTADELVKVSANDTTEGYLEDKVVVSTGANASSILEVSTLNDGANEDLQIQIDQTRIDHDQLTNFAANEHVDHSGVEIQTAADSGLSGGGDITTTRSLSVDINGTTAESSLEDTDELLVYDTSVGALRKATKADLLAGLATTSPGDIAETSFSGANNQAAPANVTGFAFANATARSFNAHVSVVVDATGDLFEEFDIQGIQTASGWDISVSGVGDDSDVAFTITSAGQIQYTSANYAGFTSLTIKFRAVTTSV